MHLPIPHPILPRSGSQQQNPTTQTLLQLLLPPLNPRHRPNLQRTTLHQNRQKFPMPKSPMLHLDRQMPRPHHQNLPNTPTTIFHPQTNPLESNPQRRILYGPPTDHHHLISIHLRRQRADVVWRIQLGDQRDGAHLRALQILKPIR